MQAQIIPVAALQSMQAFYHSGKTRSYEFRKTQLEALQQAVINKEAAINKALYDDLGKSPEEVYATETGPLLSEIRIMLKNLKSWMQPKKAKTNLLNFPSASKLYKDPLGVILIISPWNYPLMLNLLPLAGAIAGGNCVVVHPSLSAPATADLIRKILQEIFDEQYILFAGGDGAQVVPAMMDAIRFDHIFYTGSVEVGRLIYRQAAEKLVPVTLELGGKSPAIVAADADIKIAARRIALGKFINAGQTCIAPDYILVHKSVKKDFIETLKSCISDFYTSNQYEELGRIVNEKRFDALTGLLQHATIIYGGKYNRPKLFMEPTIIAVDNTSSPLMQEEIFGPLLPVIVYSSFEEAQNIINQNPYPLAFYLFTESKSEQAQWVQTLPFGSGCINNAAWQFLNPNLPFGGVGTSGMGRYHGKYSFETFTRLKPVMKTPTWFDPAIKYPPLKGKLKLYKKLLR